MKFSSSPGGKWTANHHTYPGGLVYHTYFNVRTGVAIAKTYEETYGVHPNLDLIRLAAIWHDVGKTWTLDWNTDGSVTDEPQIAGAGAHHVLGIVEAIIRGYSPEFIVILASAHDAPVLDEPAEGQGLQKLLGYLRAAAIIAGGGIPDYSKAALTPDGKALASQPPLEAFIHYLSDADGITTGFTLKQSVKSLDYQGQLSLWERMRTLSRSGDIPIYIQK
jgi:hypothetical protein